MLIDSNNVSIDCKLVTTSAVEGEAIPLTSLLRPGREEPVCVYIRATEALCGGESLKITISQSDTQAGEFAEVASASIPAAELVPGNILGWRWLPPSVTRPWIKITATPAGEFTSGSIFAAVVREDPIEYEDGMYIDKGILQC